MLQGSGDGLTVRVDKSVSIVDSTTGQGWHLNKDAAGFMEWLEAAQYCTQLYKGTYDDWRLPTIDELGGIGKEIDRHMFTRYGHESYWSTTLDKSFFRKKVAWIIDWENREKRKVKLDDLHRAACVRGPGWDQWALKQ